MGRPDQSPGNAEAGKAEQVDAEAARADDAALGRRGPPLRDRIDPADKIVAAILVAIEYAIVASLLLVSAVVIFRTVVNFVTSLGAFPRSIIPAVDGILVVIILLDIVHTVFQHLRDAAFQVRPFLVIGILAGVRDILSASANLTLDTNLSSHSFNQTLVALGVGVGLVLALLLGLFILSRTDSADDDR